MRFRSALPYYLQSLPTLLFQTNPLVIPAIFLHSPQLLKLKGHFPLYIDRFMDIWTAKEVVLDNQYQRFHSVPSNATVIDVGASIGDFSIMVSHRAKQVFACEMDPNRLGYLTTNIRLNERPNIQILPGQVKSLAPIFTQYHLRHCDFLKIDCEGNEYGILADTPDKTLEQIRYIAAEVHFFTPAMRTAYRDLCHRLTKLGYTLKELPNAVHANIAFLFATLS